VNVASQRARVRKPRTAEITSSDAHGQTGAAEESNSRECEKTGKHGKQLQRGKNIQCPVTFERLLESGLDAVEGGLIDNGRFWQSELTTNSALTPFWRRNADAIPKL